MYKLLVQKKRDVFGRLVATVCRKAVLLAGLLLLLIVTSSSAKSVIVSWDSNHESDLAGYKIYYGKGTGQYSSDLYVGNLTSYRIEGLNANQHYYFVVAAVDLSGNESAFSAEVDIFIPEDTGGDDTGDDGNGDDGSTSGPTGDSGVLARQAYNFPNPFKIGSESTKIRYELLQSGEVTIEILDANTNLVKRLVKNRFKSAGEHTEEVWDGRNRDGQYVSNGVYFCSIRSGNEQRVLKIAIRR